MADIRIDREVVIGAPVDVVWRTITEPDQITQWFAERVELELAPGGQGYMGFELAEAAHAETKATAESPRK